MVITGMMSWLQVEASLGLIAACLPTIRCLFKGLSPESIVNTIRSVFSLKSHSSHSRLSEIGVGGAEPQRNLARMDFISLDDRSTRKGMSPDVAAC